MSKKLKLLPKQLIALQNIAQQKQQLITMTQEVNSKESMIAELAFEVAGIDISTIDQVKLEGEYLLYELKTEDKPKGPKMKVSKEKTE